MKFSAFFLLTCLSFSSLAVTMEEKEMRIEALRSLENSEIKLDINSYEREINYDKRGLNLKQRAREEANILASQIRQQIALAFSEALDTQGNVEDAKEIVKQDILKDLEMADDSVKEELISFSLNILEQMDVNSVSEEVNLPNIEARMLVAVKERNEYLNKVITTPKAVVVDEKREYANKSEVIKALVSEEPSVRYVSTSNQTIQTAQASTTDTHVSLQVKIEFLGATLSAGPQINFRKNFKTSATILADGLYPVMYNDGNFDFVKRDASGKAIKEKGKELKRYVSFSCDAELHFVTDYVGGGEFKVAGLGAGAKKMKTFTSSVNLSSRRILLPEFVDNKTFTIEDLTNLCHRDFLKAKASNSLTIEQSLNILMKNVVAGLTFSHAKTKCVQDSHCYDWFNKEIIPLGRVKNFPRCVQESNSEKNFTCALRGLEGQACSLYDNTGKRITSGIFEFVCDKGLKCVQTKQGGWFQNWEIYESAEGRCMPINRKTYKSPYDKQVDYIEVELEIQK